MKEPRSVRVTGLGSVLILVFAGLLVLSFVGSHTVQAIAFTGCVLIALAVAVSVSGYGNARESVLFPRRRFGRDPVDFMDEVNNDDAWRREREQRERDGR